MREQFSEDFSKRENCEWFSDDEMESVLFERNETIEEESE